MSVGPARPRVKVCGLRTPHDLDAARGADLVGVVIEVASSPRTRTLPEAAELFARVQGRCQRVAVLVDPSENLLRQVLERSGADLAQVHGRIPPGMARSELARVVPSWSVRVVAPEVSAAREEYPDPSASPFVHLESGGGSGAVRGGTGKVGDWASCRALVANHPATPFLLAGGLTPQNVQDALDAVRPWGVDVATGVESAPGVKSAEKVHLFLERVRSWRPAPAHGGAAGSGS